jgi:carboxymethylenebutenolidase
VGATIDFPSNGGTTSGYLAEPAADKARGRGVVVIQEWWGLNDQIKKAADRVAAAGYTALVPDLYHGKVAKAPDEAQRLLMALNVGQAEKDLRGAVEELRRRTGKPVGTVGFCMGGALSLFAACASPEGVAACVVYYGGHPKITFDFDRLRAPVLGHWAEDDSFANSFLPGIERGLESHGRLFQFHHYPGTKHAFANDERRDVYSRAAAEQSWERTLAFFANYL